VRTQVHIGKDRRVQDGLTRDTTSVAMALPASLRSTITPQELEFIACEELVDVVPLFSMERMRLFTVCYQVAIP
jgi:hypothetical protein